MTPPALLDAARAAPALETASFSTILRICNYIERGNTISTDYMLAVGELALSFISNPNARMGASAVCTRFVALLDVVIEMGLAVFGDGAGGLESAGSAGCGHGRPQYNPCIV